MIATDGAPIGDWFVAFYNDDRRYWWSWMCRDGFRHVAAFTYDAEHGVWILYDVTTSRTHLRARSSDQMDAWVDALPANRKIVRFKARSDCPAPPLRVGFWCSPAVAHVVGVASRALRPEALYRDLVAQGALPAFE